MAYSNNEWHLRDPEAVASVLGTDTYRGLTKKEAAKRKRRDGKNTIWHIKHASGADYALRCVGDLTAAVLIIASLTAAVFEQTLAAAYICVVVAIGIILRTVTYVKTRNILETMADEGIPSASVIRDGVLTVLRTDEIVQGDIVLLEAGDVVPCDGRIVFGEEIKVSEKGITDNRTTVIKRNTIILTDNTGAEMPCEYRVNMLYAGSSILSGKCRIVATACGEDALVSMKYGGLLIPSGDEIPLMNKLERWCSRGSLIMLLCVLLISGVSVLSAVALGADYGFADSFIDAVALAAASVSSYLVTSGYIALTVPLWRIAKRKKGRTVLKDTANIEKLANVGHVIVSDAAYLKSGLVEYTSFYSDLKLQSVNKEDPRCTDLLTSVLKTVSYKVQETSLSAGEGKGTLWSDVAARLASNAVQKLGLTASPAAAVIDHQVTKNTYGSCDNVIAVENGSMMFYSAGDVRDILSFSDKVMLNGQEQKLTEETRRSILMAAIETQKSGGVMIALSHRVSPYNSLKRVSVLQSAMCFEGFIVVDEEPAHGVMGLRSQIKETGLSVILLSSTPAKDAAYLEKLGLGGGKVTTVGFDKVLSGASMPEGSFVVAVPPRDTSSDKVDAPLKLRLSAVNKLSEHFGDCAVMTAQPAEAGMITDGVLGSAISDSPKGPIPQNLKRKAEISVYPDAEQGCGGFAETVRGIFSARCALDNLSRSIKYLTISQLSRLICVLLSVIVGLDVLHAVAILFLGMILDFCALLVLSFSHGEIPENDDAHLRVIPTSKQTLHYGAFGALAGAAAFCCIYFTDMLTAANGTGACAAGLLTFVLMSYVLLTEFVSGERTVFRRGIKFSFAYVIYAVLTLATALAICLSHGFCRLLEDTRPGIYHVLCAAVCAALVFAFCELMRFTLRRRRTEKA